MKVSACMIVKDEEKCLRRCLDSIKEWVDEIIIVDTGSTDGTVIIAEGYGAKIYHQKWKNDFSFHRNYSISKATGDWIFIIDADEEVPREDGEAIKKMLIDGLDREVIFIDLLNVYGETNTVRSRAPSARFFKRSTNPKYVRAVHNRPVIKENAKVYRLPFRVIHYGYDLDEEGMRKKYKRTVRMCKKLTEDEPDKPESWLHYAKMLKVKDGEFNFKDIPIMEETLTRGIELCDGVNDGQSIYLQLLALAGLVQLQKKEYKQAVTYVETALKHKPDYLDALIIAGFAYTYGIDAKVGEKYLQQYLTEQELYGFSDKIDSLSLEFANERIGAYKALIDIEKFKNEQPIIAPREEIKEERIAVNG